MTHIEHLVFVIVLILVVIVVRSDTDSLVFKRLTRKVIYCSWDDLCTETSASDFGMPGGLAYPLFKILANLVVELEPLFEFLQLGLVNVALLERIGVRWVWRAEEIEERVGRVRTADHSRAVRVCIGVLVS